MLENRKLDIVKHVSNSISLDSTRKHINTASPITRSILYLLD